MPETLRTGSKPLAWHPSLAAAAVFLALAASPSWAAGCDGYVGGDAEAARFWDGVSQDGLRACIEAYGVDARDEEYGGTPLHWAAKYANGVLVSLLLEAGADLQAESKTGGTPLGWVSSFSSEPATITAVLLDAGADPMGRNDEGLTPLHAAAANSADTSVIALLVGAGADIGARDDRGRTPLHFAAALNGHPTVVAVLIEAGADVNTGA